MTFEKYVILNESLRRVAASINVLCETKVEPKLPYVRLKVNPYILGEKTKRCISAVTAHDLSQYKNKVYSIQLQENFESWHDKLLDKGEVEQWN